MVDRRVHRGCRPRVRGADPAARRRRAGGSARVLDIGCGDGQISRMLAARRERRRARPTWNQITRGPRARRGSGVPPCGRRRVAVPGRHVRRSGRMPRVRAHRRRRRGDRRGGSGRAAGRTLLLLPQPPAAADAGERWIDDQVLDPPEQYWRIGPYLVEAETIEQVELGVYIRFIHRPLSRYLNTLAEHGLVLERMMEPAPPSGFIAQRPSTPTAATIPRLLYLRLRRDVARRVERWRRSCSSPGLSGAGRSAAAAVLEDLGFYVVDNLPTSLMATIVDLASQPGWHRAPGAGVGSAARRRAAARGAMRAAGHRVTIVYLDASTPVLVQRYDATRRRHPFAEATGGAARGDRARARRCWRESASRPTS